MQRVDVLHTDDIYYIYIYTYSIYIFIWFNKAERGKRVHTFEKLQSSISGKKLQYIVLLAIQGPTAVLGH